MTVLEPPVLDAPVTAPVSNAVPRPGPGHAGPLRPQVAVLLGAVDRVRAASAWGSPVDCAALLRAAEALHGLALRELAAVDASQSYLDVGVGSASVLVEDTLGVSRDSANAMVRLAGRLSRDLSPVGELLQDGRITLGHARALMHGLHGIEPELVEQSLPALCQAAQHATPAVLASELRERAHALDDRLAERQERRQRERAAFHLSELADGSFVPAGLLRPQTGQWLQAALDAQVHAQRVAGDRRTAGQRREAALGLLARHAAGCPQLTPADTAADTPDNRSNDSNSGDTAAAGGAAGAAGHPAAGDPAAGITLPGVELVVLVGAERLTDAASGSRRPTPMTTCPGDTGGPGDRGGWSGVGGLGDASSPASWAGSNAGLTDPALLRLACDASVSRLVLSPAGAVLDAGRRTPTVSPAQRRAVIARDRHCVARGCRRRPGRCDVHHVWHWARGGPSDLSNLALLCHEHHHDIHDRDLQLHHHDGRRLTPDGYQHDSSARE